ncbi:TPM domain-containing protein [Pseudomarimonas arenosa]|uniref:TPM domain-containing protein n=1 Tax=Pseudomarimonas arenosa TaxID=2774145 RepID=A0AAW3ZG70_9GAMM|nr:TPM domain-containing protein [Pseudomarimonas arenosa]MBD8525123.1 TPM domain-containing protein [Pseudomarimonas arenosa]
MRAFLITLVLLQAGAASALDSLPTQTGAVTDKLGVLTAADLREIERAAARAEAEGAELAVLLQSRSGMSDHRAYATGVFNHWQLGTATSHRGVLIYLALDDRAAEIILGDGVDDDARVAAAERIMQSQMIPRLRQGQVGAAVVVAAQRVAVDILGVQPAVQPPVPTQPLLEPRVEYERDDAAAPSPRPSDLPLPNRTANKSWWVAAGGATGVLGLIGLALSRWWLRRRPPRCQRCHHPMELLDEAEDDLRLSEVEQAEERLRSVDYDVWHCARCQEVQKRRYGAWFTSYSRCPQCHGITKQSKQTTLQAATRHSTGLMQIDEHCQHCGHHQQSTRVLARLPPPSSSSSRLGGRSGGGGRSSGRGASGRW